MPKKARYPVFLVGLVIILLGSLTANYYGAGPITLAEIVIPGFVLLMLAVLIR